MIYLEAGATLSLVGRGQIIIHYSNVTILSDGAGATIDAGGHSRHFEVAHGGSLHLENVRLINGGVPSSGGSV